MSTPNRSCHHLHSNGHRCGSPALRGEQFCFYHHPTRRPPARTTTRTASRTSFQLPPITDTEEFQIALSEIIGRIADNSLDPQRAGLLLASLQMAKANLVAGPAYPPEPFFTGEGPSSTVRSTEVPDFSDLSRLLSVLAPHPTPTAPGH